VGIGDCSVPVINLDYIGSSNKYDSSAAILASVRMLKQFEKDGIKWEKLAKEIAQK
jgi:hypothetical protein